MQPTSLNHLLKWWREPHTQPLPAPDWRLIAFSGLLFLLTAIATLGPSSYFLHNDTPVQDLAALLFLRKGIWAYSSNKALLMWIMAGVTELFGANPLNETILLAILGSVATMALYDIAWIALRNRRAALLAVIVWLSLGSVLFYLRIHIGYTLAFFNIGIALMLRRQYAISAGFLLAAIFAHTAIIVPVGIWLVAATLLGVGPVRFIEFVQMIGVMLGGYLAYEYVALRYTTVIWYTAKNFLAEVAHRSRSNSPEGEETTLALLWETLRSVNGLPAALLILISLLPFPAILRRISRQQLAIYVTGVVIVVFFTVRTVFLQYLYVPRVTAGMLPFLAISAAGVIWAVMLGLHRHAGMMARLGAALIAAALVIHFPLVMLAQVQCSHTAYPEVEAGFRQAAADHTPVIYVGNSWAGAYFREITGATVLINPPTPPVGFEARSSIELTDLHSSERVLGLTFLPPDRVLDQVAQAGVTLTLDPSSLHTTPDMPDCGFNRAENVPSSATLSKMHPLLEGLGPHPRPMLFYIWEAVVD